MATQVTLVGMWASPPALRIEWALKYKGICYEYIDVEALDNKSQRLLLTMHNPVHKKIPILVHGDKQIAESLIILEYIDETWIHNPIMPEHPHERAMARFWANFGEEKCYTTIKRLFASSGDDQETSRKEALDYLEVLNKLLSGKKFFSGGESIGFLDIVLGWMAYWIPLIEDVLGLSLVDETSMPALKEWFKAFLSVKFVEEILPPRERMISQLYSLRNKHLTSQS